MKHKTRAVIFDLDGTLVDSLPDITSAMNRALDEVRLARVEARDVRCWIGDGLRTLCMRALESRGAPQQLEAFFARMAQAYAEAVVRETRCYPNVLKMLDLLNNSGVPAAVLTNKPHALAERIIDALALRDRLAAFRGYRCEEDKKPSPRQAVDIARELNIDARDCAIVGDSIVDIATAGNAGMRAIAVTWGYQEKSELAAARPDDIIDEPLDLIRLLELGS